MVTHQYNYSNTVHLQTSSDASTVKMVPDNDIKRNNDRASTEELERHPRKVNTHIRTRTCTLTPTPTHTHLPGKGQKHPPDQVLLSQGWQKVATPRWLTCWTYVYEGETFSETLLRALLVPHAAEMPFYFSIFKIYQNVNAI